MKCYILLPCYNEAPNIKDLIDSIMVTLSNRVDFLIVAVNDGSTDGTYDVLKELMLHRYPLLIVNHKSNMGLNMALRSGIASILKMSNSGDVIVVMDADRTHNPKLILKMLKFYSNGCNIVIASRYVRGGMQLNVPLYRVILSFFVNVFLRVISGIPVRDLTSGYRLYDADLLKNAVDKLKGKLITSKGFEVAVELLVKLYYFSSKNIRICEIPLILDYGKKKGNSKMNVVKTIFLYLLLMLKIINWRKS